MLYSYRPDRGGGAGPGAGSGAAVEVLLLNAPTEAAVAYVRALRATDPATAAAVVATAGVEQEHHWPWIGHTALQLDALVAEMAVFRHKGSGKAARGGTKVIKGRRSPAGGTKVTKAELYAVFGTDDVERCVEIVVADYIGRAASQLNKASDRRFNLHSTGLPSGR